MKRYTFFLILLVFLDQLSKFLIRSFGGFYLCNVGIAFGIKINLDFLFLLGLILIVCVIKFKKRLGIDFWPLVLIVSGGISNFLDRLIFGCVIDFINLEFWPVFNLADIFIVIGAIIILFPILFTKKETKF